MPLEPLSPAAFAFIAQVKSSSEIGVAIELTCGPWDNPTHQSLSPSLP
jgi:hypothetical protein